MLKTILLLAVSLGALVSPAAAQLHVGVQLGKRVSVRAYAGPHVHHGSSYRRDITYRTDRVRRHHYQPVYRTVYRKVWVPGHYETVHVPACYEWRYDACGRRIRVLVRAAHAEQVWRPGYYETVPQRVLVRL